MSACARLRNCILHNSDKVSLCRSLSAVLCTPPLLHPRLHFCPLRQDNKLNKKDTAHNSPLGHDSKACGELFSSNTPAERKKEGKIKPNVGILV